MNAPAFKKIVIVGLGLMGGSLAAAIRKKFPRTQVIGVARRAKTLSFACKKKWIHEGFLSLEKALPGADLVVICTPVDLTEKILVQIDKATTGKILVTDVGSVKASIDHFLRKRKLKNVCFIGAHPMVGSHENGIEAASENLYEQGLTIITGKKSQKGFSPILAFWKAFSRKVIVMNSAKHDQRVAEISHLPHLLSVCLMQTPAQAALEIAAAGFRDTTRLAAGPDSVWMPIFIQNRKALGEAIKAFKINLDQVEALLKINQTTKIAAVLRGAALRRKRLFQSTKH